MTDLEALISVEAYTNITSYFYYFYFSLFVLITKISLMIVYLLQSLVVDLH